MVDPLDCSVGIAQNCTAFLLLERPLGNPVLILYCFEVAQIVGIGVPDEVLLVLLDFFENLFINKILEFFLKFENFEIGFSSFADNWFFGAIINHYNVARIILGLLIGNFIQWALSNYLLFLGVVLIILELEVHSL